MKKIFIIGTILLSLGGCTNTSDFPVAIDEHNIYYNECFNVLNIWWRCELKAQPTQGKPVMQRVQDTIASDKFIKNEF